MPLHEAAVLQPISPSPSSPKPMDPGADNTSLRRQLLLEIDAMARYAFSAGMQVPPELLQSLALVEAGLQGAPGAALTSLAEIGLIHVRLAALVAPAMPQTIYLLQCDKAQNNRLSILGPLPAVRRLMLAALFFTLVFILVSLSPYINVLTMRLDIYRMDSLLLLNVLTFLMSAAGIGATFQALFTAHSRIASGTYDPRYESSFWTQISLGVIAGLVLSQVIPLGPENLQGIVSLHANELNDYFSKLSQSLETTSLPVLVRYMSTPGAMTGGVGLNTSAHELGTSASIISKPVLALLGGFSATLVYTVMQRAVTTLESLFKANGPESRSERGQMSRDIVAELFGLQDRSQKNSGKPESATSGTTLSATRFPASNGQVLPLVPQGQESSQQGEKTEER